MAAPSAPWATSATVASAAIGQIYRAVNQHIMQNAFVYLITETGHVLIVRDSRKKKWGPPGGKVDGPERSFAAAKREFHEETGFPYPPSCLQSFARGPPASIDYGTDSSHTRYFFCYIKLDALKQWAMETSGVNFQPDGSGAITYDLTTNPKWIYNEEVAKHYTPHRAWVECDTIALVPIAKVLEVPNLRDASKKSFQALINNNPFGEAAVKHLLIFPD